MEEGRLTENLDSYNFWYNSLFFQASRETCARCGRAIMEATLKALGQVYHPNCFVCSMCPQSLEGVEFFVTEENKPMCKACFGR